MSHLTFNPLCQNLCGLHIVPTRKIMGSGIFDAILFFIIIAHYCISLNTAEIKKGQSSFIVLSHFYETLNQKSSFVFGSEKQGEGGDGRSHWKALLKVHLEVSWSILWALFCSNSFCGSHISPVDTVPPRSKSSFFRLLGGSTFRVTIS